MNKYESGNTISGANLGIFEATSVADALGVMGRDAGYADWADACSVAPAEDGEIVVTLVEDVYHLVYQLGATSTDGYPTISDAVEALDAAAKVARAGGDHQGIWIERIDGEPLTEAEQNAIEDALYEAGRRALSA